MKNCISAFLAAALISLGGNAYAADKKSGFVMEKDGSISLPPDIYIISGDNTPQSPEQRITRLPYSSETVFSRKVPQDIDWKYKVEINPVYISDRIIKLNIAITDKGRETTPNTCDIDASRNVEAYIDLDRIHNNETIFYNTAIDISDGKCNFNKNTDGNVIQYVDTARLQILNIYKRTGWF